MLRRRLFVVGIVSFVVGLTAVRAEPVNRELFASRDSRIVCNDDSGTSSGSPCRRSREGGFVELVTPSVDDEEPRHGDILKIDDDDSTKKNIDRPTAIEEARGKKKGRGYLKVLFMMAAAAKATMLYVMIHGVALVAGKALVVAKIALALAAAVALKKALGEHGDKTSYEIVKHPQHSFAHTHSASVDYDHHGSSGGYDGGHRRKKRYARRNPFS